MGAPSPMPAREIRRRFTRLTALNILANLTVPLASLVDTALLGRLAEIRFLAGVALAGVLFDYLYWTFGFLRMGTTGSTAQAVGRGEEIESYRVLYRALGFAAVAAAALLLLRRPLADLGLGLLAETEEVSEAAHAYFSARIWAAPATLANFALVGWFLGRLQSREVLWMTLLANLANVVLDYLFIVRFGWAAFGAGAATAISQYAMLALGLVLFAAQRDRPGWLLSGVLDPEPFGALFRLNREILIRTLALLTAFALFFRFSAVLGVAVLAANTILHRLVSLAAYLIDGAAFAVESLAGRLAGAGDRSGLERLRALGLATGAAGALLVALPVVLAPAPILGLFTHHAQTLSLAHAHAGWLLPVLLIGSVAYLYDGLFLGLTRGAALRNSMLVSLLLCFLPLGLVAVRLHSTHLLWAALGAFLLCRAVTLAWADAVLSRSGP